MIKSNLKINGKKIYLKKLSIKIVSRNYFNWFRDDEIKKFIKSKYKSNNELLNSTLKELKKKNQIFFGIFTKKTNFHIGNIKFHDINLNNGTAWLGILIGEKKYRNKNIGNQVINLSTEFLFLNFGIESFYLNVDKKNKIAIKSYLKSGFKISKTFSNEYLMTYNFKYNKLILGTAQFGKPYGISNNSTKKISNTKINKILNKSKLYISQIDTAEDYKIGISMKKKFKNFIVNTKVDVKFLNRPLSVIKPYFNQIKKNYKINILFVRNLENDFKNFTIIRNIKYLKKNKIINKIGISIYTYENIVKLFHRIKYDVVQIPVNIFDNRSDKYENFFLKNKIEVHARSVFLQGLMFMKEKKISYKFKKYKRILNNLHNLLKNKNLDLYDVALSHVFLKKYIGKVIFGVHNLNQLNKILRFKFQNRLSLLKRFDNTNNSFIDPRNW